MFVTHNRVTKVFNPRGKHVATIKPHLGEWLLEKRIKNEWFGFTFSSADQAIHNAL